VSLLQTWAASAAEELASHRSVAPLGRGAFRARRKPRHWCSSLCPVPNSNLQLDFNVSVFECFDTSSLVLLRELDESNRFVQKSAESTSI
jgi:hypothetical protein